MHVSQEKGKRRGAGQDMAISIQADGNVNINVNLRPTPTNRIQGTPRHAMYIPGLPCACS